MPFMHPALFYGGAAAASVPIIIHLLNRRRFKVLDWAAMRFLLESVRRNRRRVRLEELILLALRCLAVLLLAVAVGRFLGCTAGGALPLGTPAETTHVFILDDSVSMGQKIGDATSLGKAASDLATMLEQVPSTDRVAILLTSRPTRQEAVFDLNVISDVESLGARLRSLKPSDTSSGLVRALRTAGEIFKGVSTEKRLYLLSDFRRVDYAPGRVEPLRKELAALADRKVRLTLMNYGAGGGGNLTAEALESLDKLHIAGVPVRVQLRVRNNGPRRAENVSVSFTARDASEAEVTLPTRTIRSIDPGQTQLVQLAYVFPDPGPGVIQAHLAPDALAGDNVASLALRVREARKVLIADGEMDVGVPLNSDSYYLARALDPWADGRYGNRVTTISPERLSEANLGDYDAVILTNVADISPEALTGLERYVRAGGGLAIFTGDRVDTDFYDKFLFKGGAGLCPARLGPPVGDARGRRRFVRLQRGTIANDAVVRAFQGQRSQFTRLVRFYAYNPVLEMPPPAATEALGPVRVLARFDDARRTPQHSPAILSRRFGAGAVVLVCTSADTEWTDWPKDMTYVAFANDMLEFISRLDAEDLTGAVGSPIDYDVGAEFSAAKATLKTPAFPEQDLVSLEGRQVGSRRVIHYAQTRYAGIYRLTLDLAGRTRTVMFARNVEAREGRLDVASEQQLRAALGVDLDYRDRLAPAGAKQVKGGEGREYWKAALAAMLLVLAVEVFLGQRFGHYHTP